MKRKLTNPRGTQLDHPPTDREETISALEKLANGEIVKAAYLSNRRRIKKQDRAHAAIDLQVKRHM